MFNWLRELLELRYEFREKRLNLEREENEVRCESCEILKIQLDRSNIERDKLLFRILERPTEVMNEKPVDITPPRNIPWNVRKQMLEQEDRMKAKLMREAPSPQLNDLTDEQERRLKLDNDDLEKRLGIEKERERG